MSAIEAGKIRSLQQEFDTATGIYRTALGEKLARIADSIKYGESAVHDEDTAGEEDAITSLVGFGGFSFADYMYGD